MQEGLNFCEKSGKWKKRAGLSLRTNFLYGIMGKMKKEEKTQALKKIKLRENGGSE